eukprot:4679401-Alexandrium_andersonii.AAC.1
MQPRCPSHAPAKLAAASEVERTAVRGWQAACPVGGSTAPQLLQAPPQLGCLLYTSPSPRD